MTSKQRAERFTRCLMEFDELSQTILKGHLMLEEELSAILDKLIGDAETISEAKLTFFQKLKLVQAAFGSRITPETWSAIEKLNSLRNQMAHQLDSPKMPKIISEMVSVLQFNTKGLGSAVNTREYQMEMVALALMLTYSDLLKLKEGLPARNA